MWSPWTSSAPTAGAAAASDASAAVAAPSPSAPPPADALASSSAALVALAHRIARRLRRCPPTYLYAAAAAMTVAVAVTGVRSARSGRAGGGGSGAPPRSASRGTKVRADRAGGLCGGSDAPTAAAAAAASGKAVTDDDDDIEFADPAESAFLAYVHRVKRQKEVPLMAALAEMQACADELEELRRRQQRRALDGVGDSAKSTASTRQDESVDGEESMTDVEDDAIAKSKMRLERLAVVSDELLTQWVCSLDGVPVRQSEALKQRRKALVQEATALTGRIMPYLPHVNK